MIRLDTITRSLQIVLGAAKTTNDMPVVVSYAERTATANTTTEGTQLASSNGITAVTICASPSSSTIVRSVEHISVFNADTASKVVIINLLDTATSYALIKCTLDVGDELTYTNNAGWQVTNSSGFIKTSPWQTLTSAQLAALLTDETGTGLAVFSDSPALTGIPTAPTAAVSTNTTQLATTAFVQSALHTSITLATAQNTTGTSIDFTGIPNTVKRITVIFNFVSTNGTSPILVQLGSGSVQTTGYLSFAQNGVTAGATTTSGILVTANQTAAGTHTGHVLITNITSNTWIASGVLQDVVNTNGSIFSSGVTTSGTLDRLRLTTINGTDAFDSGAVNILYEG